MTIYEYVTRMNKLRQDVLPPGYKTLLDFQKQDSAFKLWLNTLRPTPVTNGLQSYLNSIQALERMSRPYIQEYFDSLISRGDKLSSLEIDFGTLHDSGNQQAEEEILIDESNKAKRIIVDIYRDHTTLLKLSPREFEQTVAELLSAQGFKVELTKQTRDDGYDILAIMQLGAHQPLKFLVECKRYTKEKIGVEIIRSFKEVIATEKANRGIIVTTSYFTKDAIKKQAEIPYLLDYKDKDAVMEWVAQYISEKAESR